MGIPFSRELRARFCARSLDRLSNIEANWCIASQSVGDAAASEAMLREIHTMKGDADMLGFVELRKLCAAAEKMVTAASSRGFSVGEDLSLLVGMAVQFMTMLLQSPETKLSGIDVDGFVAQVDAIVDSLGEHSARDPLSPSARGRAQLSTLHDERLSPETLERLAIAATTAFVEMLCGVGESRRRLKALWELLRGEVVRLHQTGLAEEVAPHVKAAEALAERQAKRVRVIDRIGDAVVARTALDAVNAAAVHVLRNAIDHGIETPAVRRARGKPEEGSVTLSASADDRFLRIVIEDDGAGVELDDVRRVAIDRGLCEPDDARPDEDLLLLLFEHGFTTRKEVSEVSGLGVGLDAVKRALESIGGGVAVGSRPGEGTEVTVTIPIAAGGLLVHRFAVAGSPLDFAVPAEWQVEARVLGPRDRALDPLEAVALRREGSRMNEAASHVLSLRRDAITVELLAASSARLARAHRPCPTGDHAAEVIEVDGVEALLLRPERLRSSRDRAGAGRNPIAMGRSARSLLLRCDLIGRGETHVAAAVLASATRLFVSTDVVVRRGDTVELELSFPGLLERVTCTGEVTSRHVQSNPGEPRGLLLSLELGAGAGQLLRALEEQPLEGSGWSVLVAARLEALRVSFPAVLSRIREASDVGDGLVVQTAADAEGVMQLTLDGEYDLVIVDADLDDEAGGTLVGRLRALRPGLGIVVLGPDVATHRAGFLSAGADLYLAKPVAAHQLLDTMRRLLAARGAEAAR
jgi:two-component system, chemotaxis family, sensor kinase CheA